MNRFFEPTGEYRGELPRRVHARVDRIEDDLVLLETIDADWFEAREIGGFAGWSAQANEAPIGIIEMRGVATSRTDGEPGLVIRPINGSDRMFLLEEEPGWLTLVLAPKGDNAHYHTNLFAESAPIGVEDIEEVAAALRKSLDETFSLENHVVDEARLDQLLRRPFQRDTIEWVAVYDVGQGSANGLCNSGGMPLAYFDLGGGVLGNKATFDHRLSGLCVTFDPPVILSHWDWDHWSSALRFPQSHNLSWIVPLQSLGAVHAAFAAALAQNHGLNVWPQGVASVTSGQVTLRACTGNGRNHSGLAVDVGGPRGEPAILLPGDARYNVIPGALARDWHAVVVPHHGADMKNAQVPGSARSPFARAGYSCGVGNSFQHPRAITEALHHANGWPHGAQASPSSVQRRTDQLRSARSLGHFGIGWQPPAGRIGMPCGGICSLAFETG